MKQEMIFSTNWHNDTILPNLKAALCTCDEPQFANEKNKAIEDVQKTA